MSEYESGQAELHAILGSLATQTRTFRDGFCSYMETAHGAGKLFTPMLDSKSDGENDPDGFGHGFAEAKALMRWVSRQSKEFRAGWESELRRPLEEREKARAFDAAVAARVEEKLFVHRLANHKYRQLKGLPTPSLRVAGRAILPSEQKADAREFARIEAERKQAEISHRTDQLVFEHHMREGTAEFVVLGLDGSWIPADHAVIEATIRAAKAGIGQSKDALGMDDPRFETRDARSDHP